MNSKWGFHAPVRVELADDMITRVGDFVPYRRAMLLTTPGFVKRGTTRKVERSLGDKLICILDVVQPNPDIDSLDSHLGQFQEARPDVIIALGGGSAIDSAKAAARLISTNVTLSEHLRHGRSVDVQRRVPIIAIPTTSGTGAEVTPFGTIWDNVSKKKHSIEGADILPETALLDPLLTVGLPKDITVSTGLDAVSHSLESIWNKRANPITISLATGSLKLSLQNLETLTDDLENVQARRAMMVASTMAGLAISQTRTALAHSISYPLTAKLNLPHGLACGFLLPELLEFNSANDDGRLKEMSFELGYRSLEDMGGGLSLFLKNIGANDLLHHYVHGAEDIHSIKEGMINLSRASNNLRDAEISDISAMLAKWESRAFGE